MVMTPSSFDPTGPASIGQCHNCGKHLYRTDNFVHNNQTGFAYCDAACQQASEAASAPITLADADAQEAAAVRRFKAFSNPFLREVVAHGRARAEAVARLEAALAVRS
jgi:hypothetical protein